MNKIKGLLFDYGGTIDTNGDHWAEVLWQQYVQLQTPVSYTDFRSAYVHGERMMACQPLVKETDNFLRVLQIKTHLQMQYLKEHHLIQATEHDTAILAETIAQNCYIRTKEVVKKSAETILLLKTTYKLGLVSNFYGNIHVVLKDFDLLCFFEEITESAVVGIRKPDPAIYALGVKTLGLSPNEVVVIGDSYYKDMIPAKQIGCKTIWLHGKEWEEEKKDETLPDAVITDFAQLPETLKCLEIR